METTRPPGFPGNPPARMPRAPTPARSPPPRPLRRGEMTFRPTHDVGPRTQCISGLNYAAYGLPVNASRPGSPQAHASLGSGWRPTLAGWDWIPTGFRTRFRRSHHGILSPLTGLSRHTRRCMKRSCLHLAGDRLDPKNCVLVLFARICHKISRGRRCRCGPLPFSLGGRPLFGDETAADCADERPGRNAEGRFCGRHDETRSTHVVGL